jgi:hypothetical protein
MKSFIELLKEQKFSKTSKIATSLESGVTDEKLLAKECIRTKPYKENAEFAAAVDAVLVPSAIKAEAKEAPKQTSSRGGEPRGW